MTRTVHPIYAVLQYHSGICFSCEELQAGDDVTSANPRERALAIWQAGVDAVDSAELVRGAIQQTEGGLIIAGHEWEFNDVNRICIVGAGKAGAGMAEGFESLLKNDWKPGVFGWVNVPEDCVKELETIHLHAGRPAGLNEPTEAGVEGCREILECVSSLNENDLCVVLISGGGSALLPAPIDGLELADLQQVTRNLMQGGATIEELNAVRRALSSVKGGGLLRSCRAGRLIGLIISDVAGDPLETIASGPTVDIQEDPQAALEILLRFKEVKNLDIPAAVLQILSERVGVEHQEPLGTIPFSNHIIGNNQTAVRAAADRAKSQGFQVIKEKFDQNGEARIAGEMFARECLEIAANAQPGDRLCLISGGEPVVHLAKHDGEQRGGRNQEFVLAAAKVLAESQCEGIVILSGGTDGEDGPTDAAGAIIDHELLIEAKSQGLQIDDYLTVNNSYPYFEQIDGLIKTGPTHTNVMDLRVAIIQK